MLLGAVPLSQAVVTEHEIIMSLHVFRIDRQHGFEFLNCLRVFFLQKQNPPGIVADNSIFRILRNDFPQVGKRIIVSAFGPKDS